MKSGLVYFKIVAFVFVVSGLLGLILPDQYMSLMDVGPSVGGRLWGRAFGAVAIAFGAMFWMMDPGGDRRARMTGALGAALAFGLTGVGDAISVLTGDLPAFGWGFVAFHAVMTGLALYYLFAPAPSTSVHA